MKIVLVSKCSLDIEHYVEFKMSVMISSQRASLLAHIGSHISSVAYPPCITTI